MSTLAPGERATRDPSTLPDAPQPKLSPWRLLMALVLVIVVGGAAFLVFRHTRSQQAARASIGNGKGTWFAPYVDATLTPTVAFQNASTDPARNVVLGFIVAGAKPADACTPTWGTYETLDGAATTPYWYQGTGTVLSTPWSSETTATAPLDAVSAARVAISMAGTLPRDPLDALIISQVMTLGKGTTGAGAGTVGPDGSLYTSQAQTGLANNGYGTIAGGTRPTDTSTRS